MNTRRRKLVLRAGVSILVALILLELGFRILLFGPTDAGANLRRAAYYTNYGTDAFWALEGRFAGGASVAEYPDRELGWVSKHIVPGTYEHRDEQRLMSGGAEQRPVLLYGDSFSACMTAAKDCFQGLLRDSDLGQEFFMLNFGVSGHGVGQMLLMLRRTLERFLDRRPVVVVGIFIDDDLMRTGLSLRQFPKPRFRIEQGALVHDPPTAGGREAWYASDGPGITSYAWSFVVHSGVLPDALEGIGSGRGRLREEVKALNQAVLAAIAREVQVRDVEAFVLLMPGVDVLKGEWDMDWQEEYLRDTLREVGLPFVEARRELEAYQGDVRELFIPDGPARNHYNERGNRVVFETLRRGLRGEFDS